MKTRLLAEITSKDNRQCFKLLPDGPVYCPFCESAGMFDEPWCTAESHKLCPNFLAELEQMLYGLRKRMKAEEELR